MLVRGILATAAVIMAATAALAETRTFDLPAFDEIEVATGIEAVVEVGAEQTVMIEAGNASHFDDLEVRVRNGRLTLRLERSFFSGLRNLFGRRHDIVATITVPGLHEIEARSGAEASASGMTGEHVSVDASSGARVELTAVEAGTFSAEASSGAGIEVTGTCRRLEADASSGAQLDLDALRCDRAQVAASSGGQVNVLTLVAVEADASSGGRIEVEGEPADVEAESSSGGSVEVH